MQDQHILRNGKTGIAQLLHDSGAFRVEQIRGVSAMESFTTAIRKQDLKLGQLIKNHKLLNEVVKEQHRLANASAISWTQDARGRMSADMFIPRDVPARVTSFTESLKAASKGQISFSQALAEGRMKAGVYSDAMRSAALNTVNWGKNMQWAGRQLTVGLSLPFIALGVVAAKAAVEVDKGLTRIQKVYSFTDDQMSNATNQAVSNNKLRAASMKTAADSAKLYGTSIGDTVTLLGDLASAGYKGISMQRQAMLINRAAMLGELDREKATKAAITLQNVFKLNTEQLAESFNFFNMVENQTSLTMQDQIDVIPKLSGAVRALGGSYKDMSILALSAKLGGVPIEQAGNGLKTILARLNDQETKAGGKDFLANTGQSLKELREASGGNIIKNLTLIGKAIATIPDPHNRLNTLNRLLGVWRGSMGANVLEQFAGITDGSKEAVDALGQMDEALKVAGLDASTWAQVANKEVRDNQNSLPIRFKRMTQAIKIELAKMGKPFAEAGITVLGFIKGIISGFNSLPGVVKKGIAYAGVILALVGPITMIIGLFANLTGTIAKSLIGLTAFATRRKVLSVEEKAAELIAKKGSLAFQNQADASLILSNALSKLTTQLETTNAAQNQVASGAARLTAAQRAAVAGAAASPLKNPGVTTASAAVAASISGRGIVEQSIMRSNKYLAEHARLQALVNRGVITEGEMQQNLLRIQAQMNPLAAKRVEWARLQQQYNLSNAQIAEMELMFITRLDPLHAKKLELQGMVNNGLITELEMREQLYLQALKQQRIDTRRLNNANIGQGGRNMMGAAAGSGILMGVATVGMMAGSMGILSDNTGKAVTSLSMMLFMLTMVFSLAGMVRGALLALATAEKVAGASAVTMRAGLIAAGAALKGMAASMWAFAMTPLGGVLIAIAALTAGLMLMHKSVNRNKKEWNEWADAAQNTAKILNIVIDADTNSVNGALDSVSKRAKKVMSDEEKWRKANQKSAGVIGGTDEEAAKAEVLRIGVDVYAATKSAEAARRAMELAINGAGKKGIDALVNIKVNEKNFLAQAKTNIKNQVDSLLKAKRGTKERLDPMTGGNFDLLGGSNIFGRWDDKIGNEAKSKIKAIGKELSQAFDNNSITEYDAKFSAFWEAMNGHTMSANKYHQVTKELLKDIKDQTGLTDDQIAAERENYGITDDLTAAQHFLKRSMEETNQAQADQVNGMKNGTKAISMSAELLMQLGDVQKDIFKNAWGKVMENAAHQADRAFQNSMDAIQDRHDAISDQIDKDKDAGDARFDKEADKLKASQEKRKKDEDEIYDKKIKAIDDQIAAEQKQEEFRQKMFEAEKTRIQRLAEMYNNNVDLNVALRGGNMDEAAKIANNMYATQQGWAIDDAMGGTGDASKARVDALNDKKGSVEKQKENHQAYLESVNKQEQDALDLRKKIFADEIDARKKANADKLASDKDAAEEAHRLMQEQLDADLASLQAYIPKNAADMQNHINILKAKYAKYGIDIDITSKQWANSVAAYIRGATNAARTELGNNAEWADLGAKVGDKIMTGLLGMNISDFNNWINNGMAYLDMAPGSKPVWSPGNAKTAYNHEGGMAGTNSNRAGRSMSSGLFGDEIPTVLQSGEWVHDRSTTQHYGPEFMQAMKERRIPETGGGTRGLMAAAGGRAFGTAMATVRSVAAPMAKMMYAMQLKAGREADVPDSVKNLFPNIRGTVPTQPGSFGDISLSAAQLANAATIMSVGKEMGASQRDQIVAIMTAMQESTLNNINGGDRDSLGLFQQRPSQGWGTPEQIMNPRYAATQFYKHLLGIKNRDKMSLTAEAQAVQRSAFPDAYAKWEGLARAIVSGATSGGGVAKIVGKGGRGIDSIGNIINLIAGSGVPFRATSTYRPGSLTHSSGNLSYHATRNAVDFAGMTPGRDTPQLLAINRFFGRYARGLNELIYSGPGGMNMRNGAPHTYDATTRADHHDHVHVAATNDMLRNLTVPSMRNGGKVLYDDVLTNLHRKETVLTAPLSEGLERGIKKLDKGGNNQYDITVDMRDSTITSNVDVKSAVKEAIFEIEQSAGRKRKVG